jgi:hypothetical protein
VKVSGTLSSCYCRGKAAAAELSFELPKSTSATKASVGKIFFFGEDNFLFLGIWAGGLTDWARFLTRGAVLVTFSAGLTISILHSSSSSLSKSPTLTSTVF